MKNKAIFIFSTLVIGLILGLSGFSAIDTIKDGYTSLLKINPGDNQPGNNQFGDAVFALYSGNDEDSTTVGEVESSPDYDETPLDEQECEGREHIHRHYDNSTDTLTQEFWGAVHSFAIALDTDYPGGIPSTNDFLENVDTSTMVCTNGNSIYIDCSFDKNTTPLGTVIYNSSTDGGNTDRWSGTTITYQELDWIAGDPRGLLWEYGTSDIEDIDLKPWLSSGTYKLESIAFEPEDYNSEQTATTESWTKMEYFYINPNDDYSDLNNWHHTYTVDVDSDGDGNTSDEAVDVDPDADYIYWYGLNARLRSIWPPCVEQIECTDLYLDPTTLSVADIYDTIDLTVEAWDKSDPNPANHVNITEDLTYRYRAWTYDDYDPATAANADGEFNKFPWIFPDGQDTTANETIRYTNGLPGETILVEAVDWEDECNAILQYPWCTDMTIDTPGENFIGFVTTPYSTPIDITVDASNGELWWPFPTTYETTDPTARFNGVYGSPYSTTSWNVTYDDSTQSATVDVSLSNPDEDVAGLCSESFFYSTYGILVQCEDLEILVPPTDISEADMLAGDVEITWYSYNNDGTDNFGPFEVRSDNPNGVFYDTPGGNLLGTWYFITTPPLTTVFYTGDPGDVITIMDIDEPWCDGLVESEVLVEAPYCEDMSFTGDYPYEFYSGDAFDMSDPADVEAMYQESVMCFDFEINLDNPNQTYTGTLMAEAWEDSTQAAYAGGTLGLRTYENGTLDYGNPASVPLDDPALSQYTGTLCMENFDQNNYLSLYVLGDEAACSLDFEFPPFEAAPFCVDLQMSPDGYTMAPGDVDAGTIDITIGLGGSDATWTGNLIVDMNPGSGELFYTNGDPSQFLDGHLEFPVAGTNESIDVTYVGGQAGDTIIATVQGEIAACYDEFTIVQGLACYDMSFDVEQFVIEGEGESGSTTLTLNSDLVGQTVFVEYSGCTDNEIVYNNSTYVGQLEISPVDGSETFDLTFNNLCASASIVAYVDGWEDVCLDEIIVTEDAPVCYDLEIEEDEICIDSDLTDQTLIINYTGCNEDIYYDGNYYTDELIITGIDGDACFDVSYENICEDAEINAYIEGWEDVCYDELEYEPEELVCHDLSFDPDSIAGFVGDDFETTLTLNSDLEENTVIIEYDGCDETFGVDYFGGSYTATDGDDVIVLPAGTYDIDLEFENICEGAMISAYVEEDPECEDLLLIEILEVGEFEKYIFTFNFAAEKNSYSDDNVFFSHDEDRSFYTLEYDPAGGEGAIVFRDEMWEDPLEGQRGDGSPSGGEISLATDYGDLVSARYGGQTYSYGSIEAYGFGDVHERNTEGIREEIEDWHQDEYKSFIPYIKWTNGPLDEMIYECQYDENDLLQNENACYNPDYFPENGGEVIIENVGWIEDQDPDATIRIRYVGIVSAGVSCDSEDDECLTEEFENEAEVSVYDGAAVLEAEARLVSLCSYLVTRNAGDVFLEVELEGGSDISCIFAEEEGVSSDFRNVDALVILEADSDDDDDGDTDPIEAAYTADYSISTTSLCDDTGESEGLIGNLSSYVCEIVTSVSELWKSESVEGTTESVVSQATRNAETTQLLDSYNTWDELYNDLYNHNNPDSGILYFDGDESQSGTITLGQIEIPEGAWTLIVENAQLNITQDISYGTGSPTNMPSMAFITLGGDIYIGSGAHEIVGVYYTDQAFDGDERSAVSDDLTIYGSIYGYIQPLLNAANYVGPPTLDGGGIVVRYDSRIILNTPPALSEYVDINTEQAVN
jgi:hypothetical protein